jgi:p-cumate 2,3-dioxygenase beta subunit
MTKPNATVSRQDVEDFLYAEAALIDELKLDQWLALFLDDATYHVPALDVREAAPADSLYLIMDTMPRLQSRVRQYQGRAMWVENPPSRTRHMVSNIRILATQGDTLQVAANFVVYRLRDDSVDTYIGRYEHTLVQTPQGLKFKARKCILDLEALRPQGKVSIIL